MFPDKFVAEVAGGSLYLSTVLLLLGLWKVRLSYKYYMISHKMLQLFQQITT